MKGVSLVVIYSYRGHLPPLDPSFASRGKDKTDEDAAGGWGGVLCAITCSKYKYCPMLLNSLRIETFTGKFIQRSHIRSSLEFKSAQPKCDITRNTVSSVVIYQYFNCIHLES